MRWLSLFKIGQIAFGIFFGVNLLLVNSVSAAALTSAADVMSRQKISTDSNHEVRIQSPSGVNAPTDTIIVTFANSFNLGLVSVSDVDLFHGPITGLETEETLAGAEGVGVWGVGVAGQSITLTPPTDAGVGEITAGQKITIRIGTNAAGGTKQVANPGTAGRYQIAISGAFGDTATITVPIAASDSLDVSATVTGSSGAGAGGGGPSPSELSRPSATTTPAAPPTLVLSNLKVDLITTSTADIYWSTNTSTDSRIDYGQTSAYASGTRQDASFVLGHHLSLSGLTPGSLYRVLATSRDEYTHTAVTGEVVFSTLSEPRTLVILNVRVTSISDTSAIVLWETSEPATSIVQYGTTTSYGLTASDAALVRNHAIVLTGLRAQTVYHYYVLSLASDGVSAVSDDAVFQTAADRTPPTNASGFQATPSSRSISLRWTNPTDPDFVAVELRARTDRAPTSRADGRFVYQGSATTFIDRDLSPSTHYFYTLFAVDASNNASSGALADAVTLSVAPLPVPTVPLPAVPTSTSPTVLPGPSGGHGDTTSTTSTVPLFPITGASSTPPFFPEVGSTTTVIEVPDIPGSSTSSETAPLPGVTATLVTSTTSSVSSLSISPSYLALSGSRELRAAPDGFIGVFTNQSVLVNLAVQGLPSIYSAELRLDNGERYRMTLSSRGDAYIASVVPGAIPGRRVFTVHTIFENGASAERSATFLVKSLGQVQEGTLIGGSQQSVPGASVTVYVKKAGGYSKWTEESFGQPNPARTDDQGNYGFLVPSGEYRLVFHKDGYKDKTIDVSPDHQLIARSVQLYRFPKGLTDLIRPGASLRENVQVVAGEVGNAIGVALDTVQTPDNQAVAQQVVTPVVVTIAVANTATAVSAFNLLNYLQFLFTQPLLLLKRRKRQKWGVVYNALTKQPIDLAIVRLLRAKTRLVVQTRITDAFGRYSFMAVPGDYIVEVIKPGFLYPSKLLQREHEDADFVDLYHNEAIQVKEASVLTMNIPVDPVERVETPRAILRKKLFRRVQNLAGVVGIVASSVAWIVSPTWLMGAFIAFQVSLYVLFRRLALPPKPKGWGIIYEDTTRRALEHVVVRIFDKKYNKLLETQVTDKQGRYGFVVGKNTYYVVADKAGYERYRSPDLDLTKEAYGTIDNKIQLKKAK